MTAQTPSPSFDPFAGPLIVATAPSTEPQREIWTASALGDDASLAFNESITVRFSGSLDLAALELAFGDLVQRHEALRMTFSGDGLTLLIGAATAPHVAKHDLTGLDPQAANERLTALARSEVEAPFDLLSGPLFRVHFLTLAAKDYALVFTAHHIVCDGWSTAVLVKDWASLYRARVSGAQPQLPAPDSFGQYARSRAEAPSESRQKDESYWLAQFSGEIPVLDLPSDRARPPRKTYRAQRQDSVLDAELVSAVRRVGAKSRASLFATLLAAFEALVFRLSGASPLVIGIPSAGQASEGRTELVGHCVNMLPLLAAPSAAEPFSEFLGKVRKTLLDAQEHQDFTFGTLLTKLPISRDPSRLPLVSVIFNVDRGMSSEAIGFPDVQAELRANPRSYENFDLFLNAVEIDGRVELECQHNADLFDAETVRRWLASYRELLESFAMRPEATLAELSVATEAERKQLAIWNETDVEFPRGSCVHELVEARARQNPSAIACEFAGSSISFGELDAKSNAVARKLRDLGVRRGALVGVCLERGLDLLVALLATLKAGAGYVPLDPDYPRERLSFMAEDSAMKALITHSALERELAFGVSNVLCLDLEREALSSLGGEPLPKDDASADPESIAYVIYTSGSTGKPKGVLVPHRAVVNLLNSVRKRPGLNEQDVVLAITTLSFDIAVSEIWLPLVVGAKIALVSREVAADGALLREVCERCNVTFIDATPATYRLLLAAGWRGGNALTLICTGEAMPKDLALELPRMAGAVWNGYGPTETTVWSTFWRVPQHVERVLIGRPVDNTRIYVLDPQMRPAPLGAVGELFIAGDGVTHGYLNRPELTREKFVPDPFDVSGRKMYRTGDVGRYLNNGDIECLGRNDNQVKLRGFRIELGEIEDALSQHEGVASAAVILREDRPGDARLAGYLVTKPGASPSASELRAHLKRSLPDYMVPAVFVTLERMPLTPSGKIDRRALPVPGTPEPDARSEFIAPRTETEKLLAGLWATALNVPRVSIHDDFFALGGHSLLASQILARLRREHGIEFSFRKFFEAPTIARLAELIDGVPAAERTATKAIERRPPGSAVPLSLAQERLWLLEEMHPAQRLVHNLPAAWRFRGPLDRQLLQSSLDAIVARHETLRMTLAIEGNRATQRIAEHASLEIAYVDLRALPEEQKLPKMREQISALSAQLFELDRGPLFRSTLFCLNDEEHVYYTVRHNIIWDGWSFDVFLKELCSIYQALSQGQSAEPPELPVSYGDYVLWQREWIKGPELAKQIAYWQKTLAGEVADLELPFDHARPAQTAYSGANMALSLTRQDAEALTAVAHRANTTLFNVLFAAYCVLLSRYSGQPEVVVGTPVRARNLPEVENLIGPFINAVVLRTTLAQERPFLEYLADVRDLTLDAFSHQEMPLELLGTRPPIVRAFFSYQDARTRPMQLGDAQVTQIDVEPPAAANDLMLWMMDRPHELLAVANFNTEIFESETVARILRSFVTLLRDIALNPTRELGRLSLLSEEDREASEAPTSAAIRSLGFAHDPLFTAAGAVPDAIAFELGGSSLTYGKLLARASSWATVLRERVGTGGVVALALPRSLELVCGIFATFMAGLTVTVLDPRAPLTYSRRLVRAVAPGLIVTSEGFGAELSDGVAQVLPFSELDAPSSAVSNPPSERLRQAAWLGVRFDAKGEPILSRLTSSDLAGRARALADQIGSATHLALSVEPSSESLPLELFVGCLLRAKCTLTPVDVTTDEALTNLDASTSAAIAPASSWANFVTGRKSPSKNLTAVVYGGVSTGLLERLLPLVERVVTVNLSATLAAMFVHVPRSGNEASVLGRVCNGLTVDVVDSAGAQQPIGVPGRLVLKTLRGGDLDLDLTARRRADGSFAAVGRDSKTALVSGVRFELAEVSNALAHHKAVSRAVARLELEEGGAPRLVAFFAHVPGESFTDTELRQQLRALLPEFMVPQVFIELDSLPIRADGSIDYAGLPAPFGSQRAFEFVAPRSAAEQRLAEMFAEALRVPRVGVYDNFFDLGGHSLLCFRVIERIEREFGKRLSPRTLLLNSLEQVATELDGGVRKAAAPPPAPPPPEPRQQGGGLFKRLQGLLKR